MSEKPDPGVGRQNVYRMSIEPHDYEPITVPPAGTPRWRVRLGLYRMTAVCRRCFMAPGHHPTKFWTLARSLGEIEPGVWR